MNLFMLSIVLFIAGIVIVFIGCSGNSRIRSFLSYLGSFLVVISIALFSYALKFSFWSAIING